MCGPLNPHLGSDFDVDRDWDPSLSLLTWDNSPQTPKAKVRKHQSLTTIPGPTWSDNSDGTLWGPYCFGVYGPPVPAQHFYIDSWQGLEFLSLLTWGHSSQNDGLTILIFLRQKSEEVISGHRSSSWGWQQSSERPFTFWGRDLSPHLTSYLDSWQGLGLLLLTRGSNPQNRPYLPENPSWQSGATQSDSYSRASRSQQQVLDSCLGDLFVGRWVAPSVPTQSHMLRVGKACHPPSVELRPAPSEQGAHQPQIL